MTAPGKDLRVAMINGDSTAPHDPLLILPDDVEPPQGQTVKQYLETVTGGTVRCRTGRCEVKITKPIAVRIVDEGGNGLMPKPVVRELTYDLLVPSLTGLDPTFIDLNDDFAKQVPSGTDIIAFFDVNGGTLSAAPYCGYMGIEQSDGSYKYEKWASHVFLVARTEAKPAKVQIDSGSGWQDVVFADSRVIDIRVENQPVVPRHTHFEMHWKASKGNTGNAPGFKYDRACDQQAGTTVGCGASDWP
ncbi:MAG TPA: hypothetical protein VMT00_00540 [Thermoanaerobaculia bacterium]|nr:hypothetical protein [Thermoanaerobaculia bacterium]